MTQRRASEYRTSREAAKECSPGRKPWERARKWNPAPPGRKKVIVYLPEHFRVRDHRDATAFMQANPFAILISSTPDGPFATHAPLVIREAGEQLIVRGHVAKANPHWRHL